MSRMKRALVFDRGLMKRLRVGSGWTLRDLEAHTGLSNAYLSQLETGCTTNPTLAAAVAIADAFRLGLETFVVRAPMPDGAEMLKSWKRTQRKP